MDSGVPLAPSFIVTYPMLPTEFMGMNPPIYYNNMKNFGTQSTPWVPSDYPIGIPSHLQSSPWSTYMNPSIGYVGTMCPMPASSFDMSHVPQLPFTMGGWNFPSYRSNPSYALSGANTQTSAYYTYYTSSMYPLSTMLVPLNTFPWQFLMYPWVFHTRRINFTVRATPFTGPLYKGETYILTRIILIILPSFHRLQ
jgi:hypothetical protein